MKLTKIFDVRAWARKKFTAHQKRWLAGDCDMFPLSLGLAELTEKGFLTNQAAIRAFYAEWQAWAGQGEVVHTHFRWPAAGEHRLPTKLVLHTPAAVAELAGLQEQWELVRGRVSALQAWSGGSARQWAALYDLLASADTETWHKLQVSLHFFKANPDCGLYIRQLPIAGVDTKWVSAHIPELTRVLALAVDSAEDFYTLTGVRRPSYTNQVCVRVLCPGLRQHFAGLGHLTVPVCDVHQWTVRPEKVLFVENLESGLALEDIPGTVAFIGKGNGITSLADIEWLQRTPTYYWGDLDTYGLAIFGRMRARLPGLVPVLMDLATFLAHQSLWVPEVTQHPPVTGLPPPQQEVFTALSAGGCAPNMRLEQERIAWEFAWPAITAALQAGTPIHSSST